MLCERLTEPIHMNLLSLFVYLFGGYRKKIDYDLVIRQQYAFGILQAADMAASKKIKRVKLLEFGVGHGAGLLNMQSIANEVTKITGVSFEIFGFDIVEGMPPVQSYRDIPDAFKNGSYKTDIGRLLPQLDSNTDLVIGDVTKTIRPWMKDNLSAQSPIGFIAFDFDMYYGTKAALHVLEGG
jgi:hypothetical protein